MLNYSNGNAILVRYPFTDLSGEKIRPAALTAHLLTIRPNTND